MKGISEQMTGISEQMIPYIEQSKVITEWM